MRRTTITLLFGLASAAAAQAPAGADYVIPNFAFETGETLSLRVHYYTFGRPARDAAGRVRNGVLVVHGTTGSGAGFANRTFAGELFGPGQLLDTAKYYVVIPDAIGHGKSSKPSDGMRASFPKYTYNDMVLAQHELLTKALGVDHLRLMLGTSMGCMHAWVWVERYPSFIDGAVPLACAPTEIAGRNRLTRKLMIEYVTSDPAYDGGNYTMPPINGLRAATAIINLSGTSPKMMQRQAPTRTAADSVAMRTAHAERSNFDANDLIYALDASRNYDPSRDLEKITAHVLAINSADDFINPPELGLMEQLMPRVKHGRYVLLPITDETRGHGTHSLPVIWKGYLAEFLKELPTAAQAPDPRVGLRAGWMDAAQAIWNLELVSFTPRPAGFFDAANLNSYMRINADLAFSKNLVVQGNFYGFQIWDAADPANLKLRTSFVCPGGQMDPAIYGNLLFFAVEMPNGRVDCGTQGVTDSVSRDRFKGVRIFDISDVEHPKQVATVQTCRGAHTVTLLVDPGDKANVYLYGSGTFAVRSPNEMAGCSGKAADADSNTSLFRIDVIKVPLAAPQNAHVISSPRLFADSGKIAGLWMGGNHGEGTQTTAITDQCHDITVYQAIGLAAGACSGNGILIDIRKPSSPKRVAAVSDVNFAYWHSGTFNNDGTSVIFTDEWGGGQAARCRSTDKAEWGANALFKLSGHTLTPASYFKLPAAQTPQENCVAHNGSLIPVPGRDILVQAWYQGGVSVLDFTDATQPKEIAFFDRGPVDSMRLVSFGGSWGAYWYNGHIVSSEIARGIDILSLTPSEHLSQNEIDAAKLVRFDVFNPQTQPKIVWPAGYPVARAYLDQLARNDGLPADRRAAIARELDRTEPLSSARRRAPLTALATAIERDTRTATDTARVRALAAAVKALANAKP